MNMNGAQIHLLLNHLPVILYPVTTVILLWGLFRKESAVTILGGYFALLSAMTTAAAYFTGEGAEDIVEKLQDFSKPLLHTHEELAEKVAVASVAVGVLALLTLPIVRNRVVAIQTPRVQSALVNVLLILCLAMSVAFAVVAHQGGLIRHTEIRGQ
jgi:glucan phosphoethanolaminetransferase (alkaline phosphatase superfamily)